MANSSKDPLSDLGLAPRPQPRSGNVTGVEWMAALASAAWVVASGSFLLIAGGDGPEAESGLRFVMMLMAVFLPVAMLWVGVAAARSGRVIREESARLAAAIEALRRVYLESQHGGAAAAKSKVEQKLEEIAAAQRKTETAIATFTSIRHAVDEAAPDKPALPAAGDLPAGDPQGRLALATPAEATQPPVSVADFIRALNFPENADDAAGFQALRRALRDRATAKLIQAAQDVLTLLSQDGIYMDDLRPDRARPEVWRKFAQGERGRAVAVLGGVRDRSCLALASGRMRQDPVFRDSVHHFLRRFDQTFAEFETTASDADIVALTNTRTARAFMLLGRVTGTFD